MAPLSTGLQTGTSHWLAAAGLAPSWNLSATGDTVEPATLTTSVGNVTTLWAWDSASMVWYFYAPQMAANDALAGYIAGKNYKDFGPLTLNNGLGFWVNYGGAPTGAPPAFTSFSPASGLPGSEPTIAGTNPGGFSPAPLVKIGATTATSALLNNQSLSATVPTGLATGNYTTTISNADGSGAVMPTGSFFVEPMGYWASLLTFSPGSVDFGSVPSLYTTLEEIAASARAITITNHATVATPPLWVGGLTFARYPTDKAHLYYTQPDGPGTAKLFYNARGSINSAAALGDADGTCYAGGFGNGAITLAAGASCTIHPIWSPENQVSGHYRGQLTLRTTAVDLGISTVASMPASGVGYSRPWFSGTPAGISGSLTAGNWYSTTITVTNGGNAANLGQMRAILASTRGMPADAGFSINHGLSTCDGANLVPNQTCQLVIDFCKNHAGTFRHSWTMYRESPTAFEAISPAHELVRTVTGSDPCPAR